MITQRWIRPTDPTVQRPASRCQASDFSSSTGAYMNTSAEVASGAV